MLEVRPEDAAKEAKAEDCAKNADRGEEWMVTSIEIDLPRMGSMKCCVLSDTSLLSLEMLSSPILRFAT